MRLAVLFNVHENDVNLFWVMAKTLKAYFQANKVKRDNEEREGRKNLRLFKLETNKIMKTRQQGEDKK